MSFDGVVTKAVTEELQDQLTNGRIVKIYQPTSTEILLTFRNKRKNHVLLISIHPTYSRLHLTEHEFTNPKEPPMFCMVLRKHLTSSTLEQIEQNELERMITFKLKARDEIGDLSYKYLMVELMGKHSNVILLDEDQNKVIDSLKHVPSFQNRHRTILPGSEYKLPPAQHKENPLSIDGDRFIKKIDFNSGKIDRQIVQAFTGISPLLSKEIVHRAYLGSEEAYKQAFLQVQNMIKQKQYTPTIYFDQKEIFHVVPITFIKTENKQIFDTTNEMLDHFYSDKAERDRVKQQTKDLQRFLKNELKKNERKQLIHERTIKKSNKATTYQKYGELITAHMHLMKQGDNQIEVVDYYDPNQVKVTIELNPDKSPSENAQQYFTKYRKLQTSLKMAEKELDKTKKEIDYLNQLLQQVEHANEKDIEEIREELREEGYLSRQRQKRKVRKQPSPEQFIATDGTIIYVGKNNKQNEYVTHRLAHREDTWLHTKQIPGSHVVIRSNDPSEETIKQAAQLAAYYSKARHSSSVPVDYTKIKYVKKPKGAKQGFVTYDQQKTIYVTPEEIAIKQLQNQNKGKVNPD